MAVHEQSRYIIYVHNLLLDQQSRPPKTQALQKLPAKSVAAGALLRGPELIHLGHALLEFDVLAFLV
jgi:hypothetical protein